MIAPDVMLALLEASPAAALDPPARDTLAAVITAPFACSLAGPPGDRHYREHLDDVLKRLRVPPADRRRYLAGLGADPATLDALESSGWLESWPLSGAHEVTLSPWAATQIRVELAEIGDGEEARWAPVDPDPRPIKLAPLRGEARRWSTEWLDRLASDQPGPVDEAIMAEEWAMQEARTEDGRLAVDEATGKPLKTPVTLWGRRLKVDPRLARRRPGPRRKVEART